MDAQEVFIEWPTGPCDVSEDDLDWDWEWEYLKNEVTELMARFKTTYWKVKVKNFGWKKVSGSLEVEASDFAELAGKILPHTENWFKVYDRGDHIAINNNHHDSPCGDEWYEIFPQEGS
jgi:hypothetical protein